MLFLSVFELYSRRVPLLSKFNSLKKSLTIGDLELRASFTIGLYSLGRLAKLHLPAANEGDINRF